MPSATARSAVLAAFSAVLLVPGCAAPPSGTPGETIATERDTGVAVSVPDATPTDDATGTAAITNDSREARVLGRLPACDTVDDDATAVPYDVAGLVLPPDATVVDVVEDGALVTVEARVPLDPVAVRRFYEFQNLGVLKTLMIEDEILEAEALLESRTHRLYVKAQARCATASTVYVVVAEGGSDARLPDPGDPDAPGSPAPTT